MRNTTAVRAIALVGAVTAIGLFGAGAGSAHAHHYRCEWGVKAQVYAGAPQEPVDLSIRRYPGLGTCEGPKAEVYATADERPGPEAPASSSTTTSSSPAAQKPAPQARSKRKSSCKRKRGSKARARCGGRAAKRGRR